MPHIILKPGKEKAIRNRHHWIFSGAVESMPQFSDGEVLSVYSSKKEFLGSGYFNKRSKIVGRMLTFDETAPQTAITAYIDKAIAWRHSLFKDGQTTAYRLINAEGDRLPGLIVDKYADVLVIQISTLGMEKMRKQIVGYLIDQLNAKAVYEKSLQPSRKEEGLEDNQGILYGTKDNLNAVPVLENGLHFVVDILTGQKTGLFLDHREMRSQIRSLAKGKRVLNCFSYTGGFTVAALAGGASRVDSVDISEAAIEGAKRNVSANAFDLTENGFYPSDVFQFLREKPLDYDIVILDPPAFAKRQSEVVGACRGYKEINRTAMMKMPKRSLLLTCSCSYHVNNTLFQQVVFQAAVEAKREVQIVGRHRLAADHPINIFHPEGDYLKSFLLYID